jgi:hypothetical protein
MKSLGWVMSSLLLMGATALADPLPPPTVIFERDLPTNNLNEAAGNLRTNYSFTEVPDTDPLAFVAFDGDDFTLDKQANNAYVVDSISTWSVASNLGEALGVEFASVSLYLRAVQIDPLTHARTPLTPFQVVATGAPNQSFNGATNVVGDSNPNITHTNVQYAGNQDYEGFGSPGSFFPLWENTFSNLNMVLLGGVTYEFAVWGLGHPDTQDPNSLYGYWFNEYSGGLSGGVQTQADGLFWKFDANNPMAAGSPIDAKDAGLGPKSVDLNVLITGVGVPEPATFGLLGLGLIGLGYFGRRKR